MSKRYEILGQIGKGGLGAVYKALDTQLQREVAIKRVLSTANATEEEVKESADKLMAEAQTLSSLNHPNIVTVFDVGQDELGGFVVMELLKGETLDETVSRGVLTQEDFTEVVYQTMEALIAAQANDVIHRDIKPTNIMVIWQASGKFQLKILDFGLAKFSKTPSVQTMDQEESVMGSIFFMAPEQFERGELDARTDLYQMGCVYYNALTGQYPFNGETAPQVMNAHLQHRVVPLEQVRPDLSPSICQWVMWMINRDIQHRPADARDALKHWPRNPEAPGAKPVVALPVETPQFTTGKVVVVRAGRGAYAPPALIVSDVTGSAPVAGRLSSGAMTGRLQAAGHTGPLGGRSHSDAGSNKLKWMVIGSIVSAVVIFSIVASVGKANARKREARIVELSSSLVPTGDASDVALAVAFLADPQASLSLKGDAKKVLERLEGNGISESILAAMTEAQSFPLKIRIAQSLAERNYTPAVPEMVALFKAASSDEQRLQILESVRALAEIKDIDTLLGALNGNHSLPVRVAFEGTVLAVLRKSTDIEKIVDSIIARLGSTSGGERQSLFRILGTVGGEKVRAKMGSIYRESNDAAYRRDAIGAYLNWPDRGILSDVGALVGSAEDEALRTAAELAYLRLSTLPGPEPVATMIPIWKKAFGYIKKSDQARDLFDTLLDYPYPETINLLREWEKHPTYGSFAKSYLGTLDQQLKKIPTLKPGDSLAGNLGRPRGKRGASINSFLKSLTGWNSPDTWFSWQFKAGESGSFFVEVDQSSLRDEPSGFVIYLAGATLRGQSRRTHSLEEFTTVRLKDPVTLEAGKVYTLILAAGKPIQPRLMDIGAVRFVK